MFVSIRSTNFVSRSSWYKCIFFVSISKITIKIKKLHFFNKICELRKKRWDRKLFAFIYFFSAFNEIVYFFVLDSNFFLLCLFRYLLSTFIKWIVVKAILIVIYFLYSLMIFILFLVTNIFKKIISSFLLSVLIETLLNYI